MGYTPTAVKRKYNEKHIQGGQQILEMKSIKK